MDEYLKDGLADFALEALDGGNSQEMAILPEILEIIIAEAPERWISWDFEANIRDFAIRILGGNGRPQEIAILPDILNILNKANTTPILLEESNINQDRPDDQAGQKGENHDNLFHRNRFIALGVFGPWGQRLWQVGYQPQADPRRAASRYYAGRFVGGVCAYRVYGDLDQLRQSGGSGDPGGT